MHITLQILNLLEFVKHCILNFLELVVFGQKKINRFISNNYFSTMNDYSTFINTLYDLIPEYKSHFVPIDTVLEEVPSDIDYIIRPSFNFGPSFQYTNLQEVESVIISLQLFASHSSNVDLVTISEDLYKVLIQLTSITTSNFIWSLDTIDLVKNYDTKYKCITLQLNCRKVGILEYDDDDWAEKDVPLTFTGIDEVNTINLTQTGNITQETVDGLYYKLDDGEWSHYAPNTELTINQGHTISFKDTYNNTVFSQDRSAAYFKFVMTGKFEANGNIMSLQNFNESIRGGNTFARLFEDCESLLTPPKILCRTRASAGEAFFYRMFYNCVNLKKAANIYLDVIYTNTCNEMYRNCKSLVNPPKVYSSNTQGSSSFSGFLRDCTSLRYGVDFSQIATAGYYTFNQVYYNCIKLETPGVIGTKLLRDQTATFQQMYYNCINLQFAPELDGIYNTQTLPIAGQSSTLGQMFQYCANMKYGPEKLGLKWLAGSSCYNMFNGCNKLENFMDISSIEQLTGNNTFQSMYANCYALKAIPTEKFLQITGDLPEAAFRYAFSNCYALTEAPELLAAGTLGNYCYQQMFINCINLIKITKELPAETINTYCYANMFQGCAKITEVPKIYATTFVGTNNMESMFNSCYSITKIDHILPATTLVNNVYISMFTSCVGLQTVPENLLPATTLTTACYQNMFNGCTSLTNTPKLPATTMMNNCYYGMFQSCISLTKAPDLPATTLVSQCYLQMFYGCTALTKIKVNFSAWSPANATSNWVYGNMSNNYGEFICPAALPKTRGANNIPNNWVIQDIADEFDHQLAYLQCTTAGQSINTQIKFDVEKDYRFVIDAAILDNQRHGIVGNYRDTANNSLNLEIGNGTNAYKPRIYSRLGNLTLDKYSTSALTDSQRYTFVLQYTAETRSYSLTVDGIEVISGQLEKKYISTVSPIPFVLFKDQRTTTELQHPIRIYNCKAYVDNELVRDLIPAMSKKNVICMYDSVEEELLFNTSTTAFQYGNI